MLFGRFYYYVKGGTYQLTGKYHDGCKDKTFPTDDMPIIIPYEMYFGEKSKWWENGGIAFLDTTKPSATLGRAYLITEGQFCDVHKQEGALYDLVIELGTYEGCPIKTFTSSVRREYNPPSEKYLRVITQGMRELAGRPAIIP